MYKSLETLRIISAVLVVMAHFNPTNIPIFSWFFGGKIFLGSIGVDVFFVISGIVMGLSFDKRTKISNVFQRADGFLISRVRKIFPLYIFATVVAAIISPIFGRPLPALESLSLDLLLIPHMLDGRYVDPFIGVGWTLRYEAFFYFLVFLSILINQRHFVTLVIGALIFTTPAIAGYYSSSLLLEFVAGYAIASRLKNIIDIPSLCLRICFLLAAIILFFWAATGNDFPPIGVVEHSLIPRMVIYFGDQPVPRFIAWGIPAIVLVVAAVSLEEHVSKKIASLGKYTYSLYLMQYFCLPIEGKLISFGLSVNISLTVTLLILFITTIFAFHYIEKPLSSRALPKRSPSQ